ncbi:hypothetical protein RDI58_010626 [Solanum bulbocastanum]|uniref:Uncharacterized protein n=1 Tax=Solanum bulbocastanum TaxID=147425 RepID=A0AAN8YG63_SOLBU
MRSCTTTLTAQAWARPTSIPRGAVLDGSSTYGFEAEHFQQWGLGTDMMIGLEKGNIACHKSEARVGTLLREGRLASRAFRNEAFWKSQINFGPPNPATVEKALWSKRKRICCHTPCLPKVPRGRDRRSRVTTEEQVPHWKGDRRRPSQGTS